MAMPNSRSMNGELSEGMTDGKYKKVVNNRGGQVQLTTTESRDDLKDVWYGIHEQPAKVRPDGKTVGTPNFVHTAPAEPTV